MEHDTRAAHSPLLEPEALPETRLQDALDALRVSGQASLPVRDTQGRVVAVLSQPPPAAPPRLGGMATPLGVYLHDGVSGGGAGFWGLVLTGMTMSVLALAAQVLAFAVSRFGSVHFPGLWVWESRLPDGLPGLLAALSPWLPLPFVFGLLRLAPLSGTHAAEHQVVHAVERSAPLQTAVVRAMPRVHPRCGTNLFAGWTLFHFVFLAVFCACQSNDFGLSEAVTLALLVAAPPTLLYWRRLGGWVQQHFATRPATDAQIRGAIFAAEQVLSRRQARLLSGEGRFFALRRAWAMGFFPVLLGYGAVIGLLTLLSLRWPIILTWMG